VKLSEDRTAGSLTGFADEAVGLISPIARSRSGPVKKARLRSLRSVGLSSSAPRSFPFNKRTNCIIVRKIAILLIERG